MTSITSSAINPAAGPMPLSPSLLDTIGLSKIVEIRDVLIEKQNQGDRVYRLESGTPAYNLFPGVADAIIKAVRDNKTFYTEATGIVPLRRNICEKMARKNGIDHDVNEKTVFVGQGGMGTLFCTIQALVGPQDTIVCPSPVWKSVTNIARLSGANIVEVELKGELGFNWDFDEFAATVEKVRPQAVVIVNPGNPTGGIYPKDQADALFDLVRRFGFYVIEDLAYEDIYYDDQYVILTQLAHATGDPAVYNRFVPVFTTSKSQNFSGLRIGYTHLTDPARIARFKKALLYTTNGINSLAQWGAAEALDAKYDDDIRAMCNGYRQRRDVLYAGLEKAGIFELNEPPKGAFYLFPRINRARLTESLGGKESIPSESDSVPLGDWMSKYLLQHGIGSIPGHFFGESAHDRVRFSYTCSVDDCREVGEKMAGMFGG
jgi:aspartate aminotransferase